VIVENEYDTDTVCIVVGARVERDTSTTVTPFETTVDEYVTTGVSTMSTVEVNASQGASIVT